MRVFTEDKIAKLLWEIQPTIHRATQDIPVFKFCESDVPGAQSPDFDDSGWMDFAVGGFWGGYDVVAWFRADVPIPAHFRDKKLALRFLVGPRDGGGSTAETLLYVNGTPLQGIDIWHEEAWLPPELLEGDQISIALRAWSGVLDVPDRRRFKLAQLNWIDEGAERFYFMADNLLKAIRALDANDWNRLRLLEALDGAVRLIDFTQSRSDAYYDSIGTAARYLSDAIAGMQGMEACKPVVTAVGHSHIDMAWLWRLSHSREKASRTFSTVLHLMRQYPEYRFLHSSPQLYKYLSQDYPEIFERVKAKIQSGEWEITGGMWIEPDTNLTSGESLIRQIMFGKRYMRDTFGVETNLVWLPDVFGYSWALPQIIKRSGMKYFMTTKISWSQFNRFPYDTFHWRGIDGSEILTHFMTTPENGSLFYTYNGTLQPSEVKGLWDNYQSKDINDELLIAFGWGDGGGGPTREMLESQRVLRDLPGFPTVQTGTTEPYFERLEARLTGKDVPVWDGELYLEYHRGTYTSQAYNKRANRKSEILLHDAEWLSSLADVVTGEDTYPKLDEAWELLLLNQFHDILPGSSIRQVYEDSAVDYERIGVIGTRALDAARGRIACRVNTNANSLIAFNPLSWARADLVDLPDSDQSILLPDGQTAPSQPVDIDGEARRLILVPDVPALGYAAYPLVKAEVNEPAIRVATDHIETPYYDIRLNECGQITSLWDKANEREVLAQGARANVFQAFTDKPMNFDAWDIDLYYQDKMQEVGDLIDARVEECGALRGVLRLTWRFYDSTITQRLTVYAHSPRIDFKTEVDWHESQILLKVAFPVDVRSTHATFDIQFGNIQRPTHWNTSWDYARFEVVGHKWVDLSEGNYGVSLLNDCKYGHDVKDNVIRLTLIKSAVSPDAEADKGAHVFTYSLLPHAGTWASADTIREGYALNMPPHTETIPANPDGDLQARYSFARAESDHVAVETVKRAENGDGWIVRVYETKGCRGKASIVFGQPLRAANECDLMEVDENAATSVGDRLTFTIKPYEIKTFRVTF